MTSAVDPVRRRVTTATALLAACSAACLIDAVVAFGRLAGIGPVAPLLRSAAGGRDADEIIGTVRSELIFSAVIGIVGLAVLAVLAWAVRRRAHPSRGGVWPGDVASSVAIIRPA